MNEEDILSQELFKALCAYGLEDDDAAKVAKKATEMARRRKHRPPFTRPGVLIDDRVASGRGIVITLRKDRAINVNPEEVLKEYIERCKYPGEWKLKQAPTQNSRLEVYTASVVHTHAQTKRTETNLLKDFNKLTPEKQAEILAALQSK